jgi:regulator of RNase E activity RraA
MDEVVRPVYLGRRLVGRAYPVTVVDDTDVPDQPYAGEMDALASMGPGDVGVYGVQPGSRAAAWGELFSCAADRPRSGRRGAGRLRAGHRPDR